MDGWREEDGLLTSALWVQVGDWCSHWLVLGRGLAMISRLSDTYTIRFAQHHRDWLTDWRSHAANNLLCVCLPVCTRRRNGKTCLSGACYAKWHFPNEIKATILRVVLLLRLLLRLLSLLLNEILCHPNRSACRMCLLCIIFHQDHEQKQQSGPATCSLHSLVVRHSFPFQSLRFAFFLCFCWLFCWVKYVCGRPFGLHQPVVLLYVLCMVRCRRHGVRYGHCSYFNVFIVVVFEARPFRKIYDRTDSTTDQSEAPKKSTKERKKKYETHTLHRILFCTLCMNNVMHTTLHLHFLTSLTCRATCTSTYVLHRNENHNEFTVFAYDKLYGGRGASRRSVVHAWQRARVMAPKWLGIFLFCFSVSPVHLRRTTQVPMLSLCDWTKHQVAAKMRRHSFVS